MAMRTILQIDNLKCGGCETTVHNLLAGIEGVSTIEVQADQGVVEFDHDDIDDSFVDLVTSLLSKAGYPPQGESDLRDKAVSYLSCVKGRMSTKSEVK